MKTLCLAWLTTCAMVWGPALAQPTVVAHRGGARLAPENTMQAFHNALALGADAIELDLHLCADGELVVIHDDTLNRTFQRPGQVTQMTADELAAVGVPRLNEVLKLPKVQFYLEIKHPHGARHEGIEAKLVQALEQHQCLERSVVISFDEESLRRLRQLNPRLSTGYLFGHSVPPAQWQSLGVTHLGPHFRLVDKEFVDNAHLSGLKVNVWTVNEEADLRAMLKTGCDAITTDVPDKLLQLLKP
jgi:glycerophosphoryl diester phosphodiesterase